VAEEKKKKPRNIDFCRGSKLHPPNLKNMCIVSSGCANLDTAASRDQAGGGLAGKAAQLSGARMPMRVISSRVQPGLGGPKQLRLAIADLGQPCAPLILSLGCARPLIYRSTNHSKLLAQHIARQRSPVISNDRRHPPTKANSSLWRLGGVGAAVVCCSLLLPRRPRASREKICPGERGRVWKRRWASFFFAVVTAGSVLGVHTLNQNGRGDPRLSDAWKQVLYRGGRKIRRRSSSKALNKAVPPASNTALDDALSHGNAF